ncbi:MULTISPECIES: hypothetical protein [Rhodococcus]|jgi:hypothetical protein|uniref:hypothetical protein n=1 Tax=Rhodococcus TaxID=1827 RepID=UPI0003137F37|nr:MULTISPECIES: hypothetical protein [Rhodococcus]
MKSAGVIGVAAATVGAVVSCSSDTHPDATTATSETTGAVEEMDRAAVMDRYHADLNASSPCCAAGTRTWRFIATTR